jgi:hypothetical protein
MDPMLETNAALPLMDEVHTASILRYTGTILFFLVTYPLYWILWIVYTILVRPVWVLLTYLAHPFILVGQFIYTLITLPLRIVIRFEVSLTSIHKKNKENRCQDLELGCSLESCTIHPPTYLFPSRTRTNFSRLYSHIYWLQVSLGVWRVSLFTLPVHSSTVFLALTQRQKNGRQKNWRLEELPGQSPSFAQIERGRKNKENRKTVEDITFLPHWRPLAMFLLDYLLQHGVHCHISLLHKLSSKRMTAALLLTIE